MMIYTDYDGSHIKGLMINLFHSEWPELIHNKLFGKNGNESFIEQFITPIVVATKGKKRKELFYTVPQYEQWKKENNNGKGWKIKYYKGLGTWQRKDGKEHFKNLSTHKIAFKYSNNSNFNHNHNNNNNPRENENDLAIVKAFDKTKADLRKEWIASFDPENTFLDFTKLGINGRNKKVSYRDFIDKELILFSVNDLHRSVPSIYDGLKPGQRKILYCCFLKNNLKTEIRVAQLGGYVSEKSAYHHGETSLYQTIINMAQDYVGSNNINLLSPNGMFGSRIRGGKDAASPRYIHTNLSKITRNIYISHDDMIVKYQQDDGYPVEPINYLPIIPMVLINGSKGIGTGWSTSIPNYNPKDIIKQIRRKLTGEEFENIHPFYRGFKGKIELQPHEEDESFSYKTYGIAEVINTFTSDDNIQYSTIQVTELPIENWTENYKKYLMDLEEAEQIENVNNMSSDIDVAFTFDVQHKSRPKKGGTRGRGRANANNDTSTNSNSNSPTRGGGNGAAKKFKKKIYFSGDLDEQFLKDMKLVSSMSCTNMVLFDINGKIRKYKSVCDILSEFYQGRISAYSLRKKAMLKSMEHELKKITNQARFIMMIIDDKLIINKRKKLSVIRDLKDNGFDTWVPLKDDANTLRNRAKATDAFENENENDENKNNNKTSMDVDNDDSDDQLKKLSEGYKYLLSMSISSLTKEKVEDLLRKQEETTNKVNVLRQKSSKDLWREDLDELETNLKKYDETYQENIEQMRQDALKKRDKLQKTANNTKKKKRGKTTKNTKKPAATKKKKSPSKSSTKSSSKTSTKESSVKVTKNTKSKKKKTLSSSNKTNPFSIAAAKSTKSNGKSKQKVYDFDDDLSESESPQISLFERANLKRNSPQKTRKRKRKFLDSDEDDNDDNNDDNDDQNDSEFEPPRKKRNTAMSMSVTSSVSSSSSKSSLPLKTKTLNKRRASPRRNKSKSKSPKYMDTDDDEDFFDDDDSDYMQKTKKLSLKKKNDSDYSDDDDLLELDEEDSDPYEPEMDDSEFNDSNYD